MFHDFWYKYFSLFLASLGQSLEVSGQTSHGVDFGGGTLGEWCITYCNLERNYFHARLSGLAKTCGLATLSIFGNIVTAWSWFGTNMLGVGLHSYGFMDKAFNPLMYFFASQMLFILIGYIPEIFNFLLSLISSNKSPNSSQHN